MKYRGGSIIRIASLAVVMWAVSLLAGVAYAKQSCIEQSEHKQLIYLLVDRSDSLKNPAPLETVIDLVSEDAAGKQGAGTRLVIGVITGRSATTRILLDKVNPSDSVWESRMKLRKKRRDLKKCIDDASKVLLAPGESHPHSAILETLDVVSGLLAQDGSARKRLVIYSDMIQNSEALSFYRKTGRDATRLVAAIEKKGLLPRFGGVEVYVAGAGGGKSDSRDRAVKNFWREYFKKAGATLKSYGPLLTTF